MRHAPDPIRGLLYILGLTLTFVGIALLSAQKGHGFFIFYILRTIYDVDHFAPRTNGLTDTHALKLGVSLDWKQRKPPYQKESPCGGFFMFQQHLVPRLLALTRRRKYQSVACSN